jgi:hypothetical protein
MGYAIWWELCWYDGCVWEVCSAGEEFKELHSEECVGMMGVYGKLKPVYFC